MSNVLEKAIIQMFLSNHYFYGILMSKMTREECLDIPTTAFTAKNGNIRFLYNPEFIAKIPLSDLPAIIEHEIQHLFRLFFDRSKNLNNEIFNIAQDITINDDIPDFPREHHFKEDGPCTKTKDCKGYHYMFSDGFGHVGIVKGDSSEINYAKLHANKDKLGIGRERGVIVITGNTGNKFQSPCTQPDIKDKYSEDKIKQIIIQTSEEANKNYGHLPGNLKAIIDKLKKSKLNWKSILRNFCSSTRTTDKELTWKRPNRRFNQQKGSKRDHKPYMVLVMDTSGSVSDENLVSFLSEINAIQELGVNFKVIECDAKIGKVYDSKRHIKYSIKDITGRGGTDFRPPFKYIKDKRISLDGLIYFTDLYGNFPEGSLIPNYRTLWVSTGDKDMKAPFGKTIFLGHN